MRFWVRRVDRRSWLAAATTGLVLVSATVLGGARDDDRRGRPPLPAGEIEHIMVIDLENEDFSATFGPNSPAVYLNQTLLRQGQLVVNYFATSHVSLGNYVSQVSGQAPTPAVNNDCIDLNSLTHPPLLGGFTDVAPGLDTVDQSRFPGQVVGDGCVFPAPSAGMRGARTIGDQLDALFHRSDDEHERPAFRLAGSNRNEGAEDRRREARAAELEGVRRRHGQRSHPRPRYTRPVGRSCVRPSSHQWRRPHQQRGAPRPVRHAAQSVRLLPLRDRRPGALRRARRPARPHRSGRWRRPRHVQRPPR